MASATKTLISNAESPVGQAPNEPSPGLLDRLAFCVDAIYRFLASVKLAVISISTLAGFLIYATFYESWYGTGAVQADIYQGPLFAVVLAFLGINILCAALIRFPWKRRQTGFVVTHAGLLTLLLGSYFGVRTSDEGQVGMLEGDVKNELVRIDHPVIRVWELDSHTRERTREFDLPFRGGHFEWGPGRPRSVGWIDRILNVVSLGTLGDKGTADVVLSQPGDPFKLAVKEFLPASAPADAHVADPEGSPSLRLSLQFKGPGMPRGQDAFRSEKEHWFVTEKKFFRVIRNQPPAVIAFSYVDRPELVDDFLKPPAMAGGKGVARFRYADKAGKSRSFDWALDGQKDKSIALPDSDLTVTLSETTDFPTQTGGLDSVLGDDPIPIAVFKIASRGGEPVTHMALANLPMVPNVIPSTDPDRMNSPPKPLAAIHYMVFPTLDPRTNGRFGQIEVLAGPDQTLYYRVFGRGKEALAELRSSGKLEKSTPIVAFGGNAGMPMTITFEADSYLPSGISKRIYEPVVLPKNQMGNGIAACRAELTVGNETREVWLSRSEDLEPPVPSSAEFRGALYELAYDVDRLPLGFDIKLDDFDMDFEPGTEQPTHFVSQVRLTDKALGVKEEPHTISMNHPLDHRGYTFYQSNYIPIRDPRTRQPTGQFQSVFQVAKNPGRPIIYSGCLLIVVGTFLQFYMRAGVFTDGGKKERAKKALIPAETHKPPADADEL
jgi:hypothetical protein